MRYVVAALAILALVAIAIFSVQNLEAIQVTFLAWSISVSKFLVVIVAYLLGMVTGWSLFDLIKRFFREQREHRAATAAKQT
ncbi:MAG: LapA family protein [Planctomycetota bacterium]|nr:MAG: LapA family protein [Planctomycetota bacterium]